jgi:hypothetical protein
MDELWQRFRTFWTPILWGLGVFLAGLIVVHIVTPDPEVGTQKNAQLTSSIKSRTAPSPGQISGTRKNADVLSERVLQWSSRLDQRRGDGKDPEEKDVLRAAASEALAAAILRGNGDPREFDDAASAAEARARYDRVLEESLALLKTQDPNVGFSRLQSEVATELSVRANRADVDVEVEDFGLSAITNIDRAALPRRLLNLALVARVVDVAVRAGVRSIDGVGFPTPGAGAQGASDAFLAMWPVEIAFTGDPHAVKAVVDALTDPERPTALGRCSFEAAGKKSDLVKASMELLSVRARPSAALRLESEE